MSGAESAGSKAWWWCGACGSHVAERERPDKCLRCDAAESMILGRGRPRDISIDNWKPEGSYLFTGLDRDSLTGEENRALDSINDVFNAIDSYFLITAKAAHRVKASAGDGVPPAYWARELASCYALRAAELLEGASLLSNHRNAVALIPVVRALYETWFACAFAHQNFRRLILDDEYEKGWQKVAERLLFGRSGPSHEFRYVKPTQMINEAIESFRRLGVPRRDLQTFRTKVEDDYGALSDGSHPTQFGLMPYLESGREEQPGVDWARKPTRQVTEALRYLEVPSRLLSGEVRGLLEAADESDERRAGRVT